MVEAEIKSKTNRYFNKYLVTTNKQFIAPRWASVEDMNQLIENQKHINPDAIFGVIDPRNETLVSLQDMFSTTAINNKRILREERGSSAR